MSRIVRARLDVVECENFDLFLKDLGLFGTFGAESVGIRKAVELAREHLSVCYSPLKACHNIVFEKNAPTRQRKKSSGRPRKLVSTEKRNEEISVVVPRDLA